MKPASARRLGRLIACFGALAVMGAAPAPALTPGGACFSAADNARLGFAVFQQAPPPHGPARAYPAFPLTAAATMQIRALDRITPGVAGWYFQWANRSNAPLANAQGAPITRKPNRQPSALGMRVQRSAFSSIDRADACTLAQAQMVLGRPVESQTGIRLVNERAQPDAGTEAAPDSCVLPAAPLPAGTRGIVLDYEVADGRTPAQSLAFLTRYAAIVHGARRRVMLLTNPLDAPTQAYTGVTAANASALVAAFDHVSIWLWGRNAQRDLPRSYAVQRAMIAKGGAVDPRKLIILFDLANTTLDDARFVRRAIVGDRLGGVMFQRDHAMQGGACDSDVNQKTAAILFGEQGGPSAPRKKFRVVG